MEQLNQLRRYLKLSKTPDFYHKSTGSIKNQEILIALIALSMFCHLFGICYPLFVLVLGFIAPLWAVKYDEAINLEKYCMILSLILWFRLSIMSLSTFDGIIIVGLWHPNLKWAELLWKQASKLNSKKSVGQKIGAKVDRFLD